jgi:hypothetical protein
LAIYHSKLAVDQSLFLGQIGVVLVTLRQEYAPPLGLAGVLDWSLGGFISQAIRQGHTKGTLGEVTLFPLQSYAHPMVVVTLGLGVSQGVRELPDFKRMGRMLRRNMQSMKWDQIGLSRADFGHAPDAFFEEHFSGIPLWIAP